MALATVNFQMDGHIGDVYVQINDIVKKGQLLADLIELKTLQSQSVEATDAIRRAQIDLEISQLTLEKIQIRRSLKYRYSNPGKTDRTGTDGSG